jgi:triosephosphate isomerase
MFKTGQQAVEFIDQFKPLIGSVSGRQIALAVPATALDRAASAAKGSGIIIGAQNLHWEREGAFTGEISGQMIKQAGAAMVIIGHSERRQFFGDTDEGVSKKLAAAQENGLLAVVCIGENLSQRDAGQTFGVLASQLTGSLAGFAASGAPGLILAYEPVWAIGTGKTASTEEAQKAHAFIRQHLAAMIGSQAANTIRILYGGSVKPENAAALMGQPDIDGVLVGGASLAAYSFAKIVTYN